MKSRPRIKRTFINYLGRPQPVGSPESMESRAWFIKACAASNRIWGMCGNRRAARHMRDHKRLNERFFKARKREEEARR